jgi:tripartite-type tricarboxylate transporter receptor subunit TctC
MKLPRRTFLHLAAGAAVLPAISRVANAQAYPLRPVRIIVAYSPGGQTDSIARLLAQKLSDHFGAQFYVENVPGAGGNIGMAGAAQAAADGYTLMMIDVTSYVVNPSLYKKVPYDPFKDFDPIALAVTTTQVLMVHPSLPVASVKDLVALIKADPGKLSYASAGVGSPSHLTSELFRISLGLDLVHVPFNGAGPAIASARLAALPDVPTMAQSGFPEIECDARLGVVAPAGTPRDIIAQLNREIAKLVALPDVKERLATLGFEPSANTPEDAAAVFRVEAAKWAKVVREASIRAE